MDAPTLLKMLAKEAEQQALPLNRHYMQTLRQAFCHQTRLSSEDYRQWIVQVLQGVAGHVGSDMRLAACGETYSFLLLLTLGDACAADREGTGSYYTPRSIARFMAGNALQQALKNRYPHHAPLIGRAFQGALLLPDEALELQGVLRQLRILDLACGSGVFLNACLDWYTAFGKYSGDDTAGRRFVAESLCGLDIRPDALESWAMVLGSRSAEFITVPVPLKTACLSSVEGDAVLEVPWVREALAAGGFDLIIGNPPYLGEKGNRHLFETLRKTRFGEAYYEGRMDLFYYFLHRGLDLLKPGGTLCQITTSYYASADFASKLRAHLQSSGGIRGLVAFNDQRVFTGAKGHHLILFYEKGRPEGAAELVAYTGSRRLTAYDFEDLSFESDSSLYRRHTVADRRLLFDERGQIVLDPSRWDSDHLDQLAGKCPEKLKDLVRINQGIVSGADRADAGGIFVLEPGERFEGAEPWLVPWFKNGDIRRYRAAEQTEKRLLYIGNEPEDQLDDRVLAHFEPHRERLGRRRECQMGRRPWYGLQWPREREIFEGPKLVAPQRSSENRFAYTEGSWFASADVYFLTRPAEGISLWALLAWLNSDRLYHWFLHCGKRKGGNLELYATPLGNAPVNRAWLQPGGELDTLGKALYEAAGSDAARVKALREQVEHWLTDQLA